VLPIMNLLSIVFDCSCTLTKLEFLACRSMRCCVLFSVCLNTMAMASCMSTRGKGESDAVNVNCSRLDLAPTLRLNVMRASTCLLAATFLATVVRFQVACFSPAYVVPWCPTARRLSGWSVLSCCAVPLLSMKPTLFCSTSVAGRQGEWLRARQLASERTRR
jgi:hypothetical protein